MISFTFSFHESDGDTPASVFDELAGYVVSINGKDYWLHHATSSGISVSDWHDNGEDIEPPSQPESELAWDDIKTIEVY